MRHSFLYPAFAVSVFTTVALATSRKEIARDTGPYLTLASINSLSEAAPGDAATSLYACICGPTTITAMLGSTAVPTLGNSTSSYSSAEVSSNGPPSSAAASSSSIPVSLPGASFLVSSSQVAPSTSQPTTDTGSWAVTYYSPIINTSTRRNGSAVPFWKHKSTISIAPASSSPIEGSEVTPSPRLSSSMLEAPKSNWTITWGEGSDSSPKSSQSQVIIHGSSCREKIVATMFGFDGKQTSHSWCNSPMTVSVWPQPTVPSSNSVAASSIPAGQNIVPCASISYALYPPIGASGSAVISTYCIAAHPTDSYGAYISSSTIAPYAILHSPSDAVPTASKSSNTSCTAVSSGTAYSSTISSSASVLWANSTAPASFSSMLPSSISVESHSRKTSSTNTSWTISAISPSSTTASSSLTFSEDHSWTTTYSVSSPSASIEATSSSSTEESQPPDSASESSAPATTTEWGWRKRLVI